MKTIFISGFLFLFFFITKAQENCKLVKAYAFYTVTMPGMQMVDEKGNTIPVIPQIERFIYIEYASTKKPDLITILYNNTVFKTTISKVEGKAIIPGDGSSNNEIHKIKSKSCNTIWRVDLMADYNKPAVKTDCKNIRIKNKLNGKICEIKLLKETQLMTLPRY